MIRCRNILIILLIPLSVCFAQNESFIERLKKPIYINSSFSFGYDSNAFKLSALEKSNQLTDITSIANTKTFDSGFIKPKIKIIYKPNLISDKIKTDFTFSISRNHYFNSSDKSYNVFSSEVAIKFGSYRWLKFSHRYLPKYYLRNYIDYDYSTANSFECYFSSETFQLSYSYPIYKKNWMRIKLSQNNLYYNTYFTEFDINSSALELRIFSTIFKFPNNLWISYLYGNNISHTPIYVSMIHDRSYGEYVVGFSTKRKVDSFNWNSYGDRSKDGLYIEWLPLLRFFDVIGVSSIIKYRAYYSESTDDILYNGREHLESILSAWFDKKINNKLSSQIKFIYRKRSANSSYQWVTDYKGFNKYEIIFNIFINSSIEILY